ncbi:MazG nucleotide pyrophosphohydrolase domain-containing protein [Oerskovia flava]|uniref:MazG nucleotide pyrophosphohydrolase domain-containing protein n=1 Tax=Oerskovia flava TaxID=2986422 RepID=UPI00223FCE7C|nr:MazG nucleotide pyrophosphohydrolase domain-containing protein [Oerskovia sp. JB1-3-2]
MDRPAPADRAATTPSAALTVSEVSDRVEAISALYARKFGIERDPDWFALKLAEEVGELVQAFLATTRRTRPRVGTGANLPDGADPAFADEVADVLAHLLLLARSQGVDVDAAVRRKWLAWEPELATGLDEPGP